jgi:hypothetical protein
MSTLFNNGGVMNAYTKKEALDQLLAYAQALANPEAAVANAPQQPSDAEKETLLMKALSTERGKIALAQAMANPIRRNLDYQGVGRKALRVDPLPQGALAVYDKDIDVNAIVVSSNGAVPESRIKGDRISVPEFEVVSNPTVRISEVKRRRFNVIDRAQQKARQEIQAQEDANIFAALQFASTLENDAITSGSTNYGIVKSDLANLYSEVDKWDLITARIFMNIKTFAGFRTFTQTDFDPVTQREVLQTGLFGRLWTADVIVSKVVPAWTVYAVADADFVGPMPIRQDIEVLPADEPKQLKLGWVVNELIGIAVANARGVAVYTCNAGFPQTANQI